MTKLVKVAVLGSTGYVGAELVSLLCSHPNVIINFLGCEDIYQKNTRGKNYKRLPKLSLNKDFKPLESDVVFLALPHGVSQKYVCKYYGSLKIIDLSADFRLDSKKIYRLNYNVNHICSKYLNNFVYGLPEINKEFIQKSNYIAVPGCYPTSILLPLIPIIEKNLIQSKNIIIDSKSGYSGAGKKFDLKNIKKLSDNNFYNYNTNSHRHICEIQQELNKYSKSKVKFSFNPHILPVYRGMMSTIYCDLSKNTKILDIKKSLSKYYKDSKFVNFLKKNSDEIDLFTIQNTNNCLIKLFPHHSKNKIIIVSVIDNLIKGAAGQAIQCFNIMHNCNEKIGLKK